MDHHELGRMYRAALAAALLCCCAMLKAADVSTNSPGIRPSQALTISTDAVPAGYYASSLLSNVDADLAPARIRNGVVIFGVTGTYSGYLVPDTGQNADYGGTGDDGEYLPAARQPSYTDNGDGTISDNVTGLMWLKDGNYPFNGGTSTGTWEEALGYCENLDYAGYTDWRLPNIRELISIVDFGAASAPRIKTAYFINTASANYWSATSCACCSGHAWPLNFNDGSSIGYSWSPKTDAYNVMAVRGPV